MKTFKLGLRPLKIFSIALCVSILSACGGGSETIGATDRTPSPTPAATGVIPDPDPNVPPTPTPSALPPEPTPQLPPGVTITPSPTPDSTLPPTATPVATPLPDFGIMQPDSSSVRLFINSASSPAIAHYQINGGAQQNVSMTLSNNMHILDVDNLAAGDEVTYFFTYNLGQGAADSNWATYTLGASTATPTPAPSTPTPNPTAMPLAEVALVNNIYVGGAGSDKPGFSLYTFDNDTVGTSNCAGNCAVDWPPLLVTDNSASGTGSLSTITRPDGSRQITLNGSPLYYYIGDTQAGQTHGDGLGGVWHLAEYVEPDLGEIVPLYNQNTEMASKASFIRDDGVLVTRLSDRGRDRHAKDNTTQDHYDHFLAQYWEFRSARIQLEDFTPLGQSKLTVTFITEWKLKVNEFRAWYAGDVGTPGKFHQNADSWVEEHGSGTYDDNFEKISETGHQYKYTVDITERWTTGGSQIHPIKLGDRMEFELSQFLEDSVAGGRKNYYGTTFLYVFGELGVKPFEWERGSAGDGYPIQPAGLSGGETTLGYNYSGEPAGRFMGFATNIGPGNLKPFLQGRRVHHTNFIDGTHDERLYGAIINPVWTEQIGKAGNHYVNHSCSACHVRNGRALLPAVGEPLEKWVVKVGDENGAPDPDIGRVLQPELAGTGSSEGQVSLAAWTEHSNGLRSPNYTFSEGAPAQYSARIAPQLVGIGLLEAVSEASILEWADPTDSDGNGISGRASLVTDPETGDTRLGRFGYKASTASVKHQIAAAFNTDIGVMTSMLPQPDCGSQQADCYGSGPELSDADLNNMVKYIRLLAVPARRDYTNTSGETVFADIGCADCHRPQMTTSEFYPLAELRSQVIHPYSDMLLHDMGPGLADTLSEGSASGSEWRTAPLWGLGHAKDVMLGDTKANDDVTIEQHLSQANERGAGRTELEAFVGYLHDGRARTIDEAIRWHGGEAEAAKQRYVGLSQANKDALLQFLESL